MKGVEEPSSPICGIADQLVRVGSGIKRVLNRPGCLNVLPKGDVKMIRLRPGEEVSLPRRHRLNNAVLTASF